MFHYRIKLVDLCFFVYSSISLVFQSANQYGTQNLAREAPQQKARWSASSELRHQESDDVVLCYTTGYTTDLWLHCEVDSGQ